MANLSTVTPTSAANSPITVAELAAHLRLPASLDAARITELTHLLTAARDYVEAQTGRSMAPATFREKFAAEDVKADALLRFAMGPVTAISAIRFYPEDGGAQVVITSAHAIAALMVESPDLLPGAAFITSAFADLTLSDRPDAITVDYVAGHALTKCPAGMKHAVLLMAALWHQEKLPVVFASPSDLPFGLQHLIQHHRVSGWCA